MPLSAAFWAAAIAATGLAALAIGQRSALIRRTKREMALIAEVARLDQALSNREAELVDARQALADTDRKLAALEGHAVVLGAAVDALPWPIWARDEAMNVIWANRAHRQIVGEEAPEAIDQGSRDDDGATADRRPRELSPGGAARMLAELARTDQMAQSRRLLLVIGGERRFFRVTEAPASPDATRRGFPVVGHGEDLTPLESLRADLDRHQSANAEVLERVGSAIAIFDTESRLVFFNRAFVDLWGVAEDWLRTRPSHGALLEELHTHRRLPEQADFPSFKRERLERYRRLMEPLDELMHLPDGTTVHTLSAPHPLGGVVLVMDDVTDRLELQASHDTLMAVQRDVLSQLAEGVAVFGGDGRLKFSNPAFARLWEVPDEALIDEPHITQVFERLRPLLDDGEDWEGLKEDIIGATLERTIRSGQLERTDGRVVEFSIEPLPDGAVLNVHLDVTDSARLEGALRAAEAALNAAEKLRETFMTSASAHLRAPLSDVVSCAEVLTNQYFGTLNRRQLEYVQGIKTAAARALGLLDDMLDLTTIEAGEATLELAPVDMGSLMAALVSLTGEWARRDGVSLTADIAPDLGIIAVDEKRLWRALFGLVVAMIHGPARGGRIKISAAREPTQLVISVGPVDDTGDESRVLSNGREPRGALALSINLARGVIGRHGGSVDARDAPDLGPIVRCHLPVKAPGDGA